MAEEKPMPRHITVNREEDYMEIIWMDGHRSVYPLSHLRTVCPCAECQGGHENMGGPPDRLAFLREPVRPWKVEHAVLVGNYAIQFFWDDGHHAGIYTWEYLRALCPCEECSLRYGDAEALAQEEAEKSHAAGRS